MTTTTKLPRPLASAMKGMPDSWVHSAWQDWADRQSRPSLWLSVAFDDDSSDAKFHEFVPWKTSVPYRTDDGEEYEVMLDTAKFSSGNGGWLSDGPMTKKEIIKKAKEWLERESDGAKVASLELWSEQ